MIYTTKELLNLGDNHYSIRKKLGSGVLRQIERGIYSTDSLDKYKDEIYISKKYPNAVLTGISAFYIYDLTDHIPDCFHLATEQHSFPIRRDDVVQSYQDSSFFNVGVINRQFNNETVRTYDLERLLIELFRLKEKYPPELYYEVVASFRKIKYQIDFYKVNQYLKSFSNGGHLLQRIKEII